MTYKRVLVKLSGEALAQQSGAGIDFKLMKTICEKLGRCRDLGTEIAVVIGAGNFWRGRQGGQMDRTRADQMGMLATMINSIAMKDTLENLGIPAALFSASPMPAVAPTFVKEDVLRAMKSGKIAVLGCGTGSPYFTTDTAAALKACEIEADGILMAKHVDGVYDDDPAHNPAAKKYDRLSYEKMLADHLLAIDATAAALCEANDMNVLIFDLGNGDNIIRAVSGENIGTVLHR